MRLRATILVGATLASACNSSSSSSTVPSLDRPTAISFACFDETAKAFRPTLGDCDGVTGADSETLHIVSFVLESVRGEVAAIDWNVERTIDTDRTVPGFTHFRVGEAPVAIVTPEAWSTFTFVANGGSYSVQSIETASFHPDATKDPSARPTTVTLPAPPADLVFVATATVKQLYVSMPTIGQLARIVVSDDGSLASPTYVALSASLPAVVPDPSDTPYRHVCPTDRFVRSPVPSTRAVSPSGLTAAPGQLTVVRRAGSIEIVASDASLPKLHRLAVDDSGATELPGYAVEVPTVDVLATPEVPSVALGASDPVGSLAQYLYAIDANDRSVLVVDAVGGAVLDVGVGSGPSDRVSLPAAAFALDILTPSFDLAADPALAERCDPADTTSSRRLDAGPISLAGVFVGAALVDGSVALIDVFDLDAACRGPTSCGGAGNSNDVDVSIARHRPRIGGLVDGSAGIATTLSFTLQGGGGRLATTGLQAVGEGPGLVPVEDTDPATDFCPGVVASGTRGQMFAALNATGEPSVEGKPLFCLLDDPHALRTQRWTASFEGTLPAAQGVRGLLTEYVGIPQFLVEDLDLCSAGVLGSADVAEATNAGLPAGDPEEGYGGDLLVLTGEMPPSTADLESCADFLAESGGRRIRIAFAIEEAYADHLVLGDFVPDGSYTLTSALNSNPTAVFARALSCFTENVAFEIRVRGAYVVVGGDSTPRHRVVGGVGGRCTIDFVGQPYDATQPDTARSFRALPGVTFIHPQVAFRISDYAVPSGVSAVLLFDVVDVPSLLRVDAGLFSTHAAFNPADQRLYVVDTTGIGVRPYALTPITAGNRVR